MALRENVCIEVTLKGAILFTTREWSLFTNNTTSFYFKRSKYLLMLHADFARVSDKSLFALL